MPSTNTIRELTLRANIAGFTEAKAALEGVVASQTRVAESARVMATTTDTASKKTISAAAALERQARAADPLYAAQQKLIGQQAQLQRGIEQGLAGSREFQIMQASFTRGVKELASAQEGGAKATLASVAAHKGHAAGMGQAAASGAELVHVLKAIGDETAAGVPITRSLALESGRLFQIMSSGGLGGAVSTVASKFSLLANPMVLAGAATLSVGAAALYAASSYRTMNEEMAKALRGVGGFSGLSPQGLNDLATRAAPGAGLSIGESREAAETFAAGGHLDAGNTERAVGLVRGYAGAFSTSYGDAGKALTDIFADPVKGAETLNERLGFLNARTLDYITTLRNQGDTQGATRALIDASSVALNTQAERLGVLSTFLQNAKTDAEHFRDALGKAISGPTDPIEKLHEAENRLNNPDMISLMEQARRSADEFKRNPEAARGRALGAAGTAASTGRSDLTPDPWSISEDIRRASQLRDQQQRDLVANQQSLSARDITRSTSSEAVDHQKMIEDRNSLAKALSNSDAVRALGPMAGAAFAALDKMNVGLATYATAAERTRQETAFSVAAIGADDVATRTLIETQKAYATTLQATKDATQAAADAERVRAEAVANAQKRLDEAERGARDQAALIGLNPYQRIIEEAKQAREALQRDSVIPAGAATIARPTAGVPMALSGGFDAAVNRTLGFEGGRLAADTTGTPTQFGINATFNPGVNLDTLTVDGAKGIYRSKYWNPLHLDGASAGLQRVAFDTSVMEGPGRANEFIKKSGGDADQFMDLRQGFEASLLAKAPGKYGRFATSWANRDASLRLDLGKSGTMEGTAPSTAGTDPKAAYAANDALTGKRVGELSAAPFREANAQLAQMERTQRELGGGFGMTADKVAGINERLRLENDLIRSGATDLAPYVPQLDDIQRRWQSISKEAEDAKKRNDDLVRTMNDVRSAGKGFIDPLIQAGLHGTSVMAALHSGLESVASKLTGRLEDTAINSLFGAGGTAGAGSPLGGSIFGALSGLFRGGAGVPLGQGGIGHMATGGWVSGPGSGTSDSVPAWLSNGEFVVNAAATRANANLLHAINTTGMPRFAEGGMVGGQVAEGAAGGGGGDVHFHTHIDGASGDHHVAALATQAAQRVFKQNAAQIPAMVAEHQRRGA